MIIRPRSGLTPRLCCLGDFTGKPLSPQDGYRLLHVAHARVQNCNETSDGLVPEFWFCDKSLDTTAVPQISARALTWCGLQYSQVRQLPGPTLWIDERQCLSVSSPILPLDDLSLREHLLLFCWDQHLVAVLKHANGAQNSYDGPDFGAPH